MQSPTLSEPLLTAKKGCVSPKRTVHWLQRDGAFLYEQRRTGKKKSKMGCLRTIRATVPHESNLLKESNHTQKRSFTKIIKTYITQFSNNIPNSPSHCFTLILLQAFFSRHILRHETKAA